MLQVVFSASIINGVCVYVQVSACFYVRFFMSLCGCAVHAEREQCVCVWTSVISFFVNKHLFILC